MIGADPGSPAVPGGRGPGDFLVVIPTYNERENIDSLLTTVLGLHPTAHVLVIDDGSPDGTGDLVAARRELDARIHLIRRPRKSGLGSAYRDAFAWALGRDYEFVIVMDADWSHDPRDIARLLAAAESADVVVGSRYIPGGRVENWPLSRLLLSRGANILARLAAGRQIHDWTAGFKCYSHRALKSLPFGAGGIRSEGYSFQIEVLFHCHRQGWRIREVPITFTDRRHGRTKMSRAEVYRSILTLLRIAWQRCRR